MRLAWMSYHLCLHEEKFLFKYMSESMEQLRGQKMQQKLLIRATVGLIAYETV
jgi:hypothetical protein